jgi:flagellar biosynthesis/type III secretory pathway protein FliH
MGRVIRAQRMGAAVVPAPVFSAQAEATAIRERAQLEAAAVQQRAYAAGYSAGQAAAAKVLFELERFQTELLARTEREATQAALLVAAELLGTTLRSEPAKILDLLGPHMARMRRSQRLLLRLHPDDAAWLRDHEQALSDLCKQQLLEGSLTLQHDASIARGGCVLESNLGELDARIETRLSLLAAALGLEPAARVPEGSE